MNRSQPSHAYSRTHPQLTIQVKPQDISRASGPPADVEVTDKFVWGSPCGGVPNSGIPRCPKPRPKTISQSIHDQAIFNELFSPTR